MEKPTKTEQGKYSLYTCLTVLTTYLAVPAQALVLLPIVERCKPTFSLRSASIFKRGGECLQDVSNTAAKLVPSDPPKVHGLKECLYVWSVHDSCLSVCPLLFTFYLRFQNHPT